MRIAALHDIHGNLPALEAVLRDVREAAVDQVLVGGDVFPGPMSNDALGCLLDLDIPQQFMGPDVELRRTDYDLTAAAARIRATDYPQAEDFAERNVLRPPSERDTLEMFVRAELK
jgi:hypothetical protein